jgi:hypothetical protein
MRVGIDVDCSSFGSKTWDGKADTNMMINS